MDTKKAKNADILKINAKKKTEVARKKVESMISEMMLLKETINFNSVSKRSGVSKSFLYSNDDIKLRIEKIREKQSGVEPKKSKNNMSDDSKDVLLAAKTEKINQLELRVEELEKENLNLRSEIYRTI